MQGFGLPVSVFAEYKHFCWADTNFNRPAASPFFIYAFRDEDHLLKMASPSACSRRRQRHTRAEIGEGETNEMSVPSLV